ASVGEVLRAAGATAQVAFRATRVLLFEPGARDATWDVSGVGGEAVETAPDSCRSVFAWVKHNPETVVLSQIAAARYGALRVPLREMQRRYGVDVLVPLVGRGQVVAVVGFALGRRPSAFERELLDHFRIEVTSAAVNVRLHREAARKLTLEKE